MLVGMLAQAARHATPDHGPVYAETDLSRFIVEPWNAASCLLFFGIVLYWAVKLRGRWGRHKLLTAMLPILTVGAVGGTVYHAFRSHRIWLFLDWVPIVTIGLVASIYLWSRVLRRRGLAILVIPVVFGIQRLNFLYAPRRLAINVSYAVLAAAILLPATVVLARTRFRGGWLILAGFGSFGLAIASRVLDAQLTRLLPMGTHFLWHIFGAAATFFGFQYIYVLDRTPPRPQETARDGLKRPATGD